jgi:hypothetical protein
VADRMSKNPATTVPQTPLAELPVATLMKNVLVLPSRKSKIG